MNESLNDVNPPAEEAQAIEPEQPEQVKCV